MAKIDVSSMELEERVVTVTDNYECCEFENSTTLYSL